MKGREKMENKIFDLIEKVYIELQETKQEVKSVGNRLTKLEIKIENNISEKIDALFEARDITNERLDRIEVKIDNLTEKVDTHDIKIQVIEGGKRKKKTI